MYFEYNEDSYDFSTLRPTSRDTVDLEAVVLRSTVAGGGSSLHRTAVAITRIRICDQWLQSRHPDLRIAGHGEDRARSAVSGTQLLRQKERAAESLGCERGRRREGEAERQYDSAS